MCVSADVDALDSFFIIFVCPIGASAYVLHDVLRVDMVAYICHCNWFLLCVSYSHAVTSQR